MATVISNLEVMSSQSCIKTRTEAFRDRQVLRQITSLHTLFGKLFEKALHRAIQGMQRMRLYLEMPGAGAGAGIPGQGRGHLGAGVQTPGGSGEMVCSPGAFYKKNPSIIHSFIKIPDEHLIQANAEIKDVNFKTICLTESSTFVKTFVNIPQEHKEGSECWCGLYWGSKKEDGSSVCPQRHSCQGLGIHATLQEMDCGCTQRATWRTMPLSLSWRVGHTSLY